mgnify:FL=1
MADEADVAAGYQEMMLQASLASRESPELRSEGAGDCDFCGEWASRLVDGACIPCRRLQEDRERRWRS